MKIKRPVYFSGIEKCGHQKLFSNEVFLGKVDHYWQIWTFINVKNWSKITQINWICPKPIVQINKQAFSNSSYKNCFDSKSSKIFPTCASFIFIYSILHLNINFCDNDNHKREINILTLLNDLNSNYKA